MKNRIQTIFVALSGAILILLSFSIDFILGDPFFFGWVQFFIFLVGCAHFVCLLPRFSKRCLGPAANMSIVVLSVVILVFSGEYIFKLFNYDFNYQESLHDDFPPYYRAPMVPQGEVYFRREGNQKWTGQVLNTVIKESHITPNPYGNEKVVTLNYDANGFRNPKDMKDWTIAVSGDSFTELGYLSYDELFTSVMGDILKTKVLNLGTSVTGPLTQLSYLKSFGVSKSTRNVMIVFFEGNDLEDLDRDWAARVVWQKTGIRPYRKFVEQHSLIIFLKDSVMALKEKIESMGDAPDAAPPKPKPMVGAVKPTNVLNGYFLGKKGPTPVTLTYTPPERSAIEPEIMTALKAFFMDYATFFKDRHITPWLVYMPAKRRVLNNHIRFTPDATDRIKSWQPSDLPSLMSDLCAEYGVQFVNLTHRLVEETNARGELLYNAIFDTHLNALGARIVGEELARQIQSRAAGNANR